MKDRARWNRREFIQIAASSLGAVSFAPESLAAAMTARGNNEPRLIFVGFGGDGSASEGIAVFALKNGRWARRSTTLTSAPSSMVLNASQRFLYVANAVDEYEGLPSGTMEAYAIHPTEGTLKFLNRQRLSLSATRPEHVAIAPDGRAVIVSTHGGGAYNVLPLGKDGHLAPVTSILKEVGAGPGENQRSAHPQMVVFDRSGRAVSADLGCDRLNVLTLDGVKLQIAGRHKTQPGEGPQQIVFHPNGRLLFVAHGLDSSLACYEYNADEGKILARLSHIRTARSETYSGVVMAMDPSGKFLYTSHRNKARGISAWMIEQNTGALNYLQTVDENVPQLHKMMMTSDGRRLLGLSREANGLFSWDVTNGQLDRGKELASIAAPMSFAVQSLSMNMGV